MTVPLILLACSKWMPAAGFPSDQFPVAAYSHIPAEARLFAPDKYGGYLIYRSNGQRKVFFDGRDDTTPVRVPRPGITVYRNSLLARTRLRHERAMPAPCDDVLAGVGGKVVERSWSVKPTIGFLRQPINSRWLASSSAMA